VVEIPKIVTKDLMRVYRTGKSEVIALRGLDLEVGDRDVVAIRGPSGCGKTTLLNLIGGLDRPTAGSIDVDGLNIVHYSDPDLVKYRREMVGFVFQFFNLVPTLTAKENVQLPMRLGGMSSERRRERTDELLDLVGLHGRATHKPDELSGGEQQRIAIAVALANDPPLILADEPTGELDTETGQQMLNLFQKLNTKYRKTIMIVTHDQRISAIATNTLEIVDGRIVEGSDIKGSPVAQPTPTE
jgi:putative ABC transport system ATP-binding protein